MRSPFPAATVAVAVLLAMPGSGLSSLHAQTLAAPPRPVLTMREGLLSAVGLAVAFVVDHRVRDELRDPGDGRHALVMAGNAFGDPFYAFPAVGAVALGSLVLQDRALGRASADALMAGAVAAGAVELVKLAVGRVRPDMGAENDRFEPFSGNASFPSGHAALAAAFATAFAVHTRSDIARAGLVTAVGITGLARIRNDRHWVSDVVAGVGLGVVSARVVSRLRQQGVSLRPGPGGLALSLDF